MFIKHMGTFKQLVKEFCIPIILASIWTYFSADFTKNTFFDLIKIFGPSFFLFSWAGGQILRVIKQTKVENSFKEVIGSFKNVTIEIDKLNKKINSLNNELGNVSDKIIGATLGGENFPRIIIYKIQGPEKGGRMYIINEGKWPLYDVIGNFQDNLSPDENPELKNSFSYPTIAIGGMFEVAREVSMDPVKGMHIVVEFSTRNNRFLQLLKMKFVNNKWVSATEILRSPYDDVMLTEIDHEFPLETDGEILKWKKIQEMD